MKESEENLFDTRLTYPDPTAMRRFAALVGIDEAKQRLIKSLGILINPAGLREWQRTFHQHGQSLVNYVESRPPLVILAGDVGTGKTELATTVGDPVARQENIDITLLPLSLSTRGSGKVGEMTRLLSAAFEETCATANRLKNQGSKSRGAVILLVDEADAIVQSRDANQMHHEDRAGVNAFIRGVDRLAEQGAPGAVILSTNRLSSIDPAVQRRAAEILTFERPNEAQRQAVLRNPLGQIGFTETQIAEVVKQSGPRDGRSYGFTYSDLTQRFLPSLVIDAYPNRPLTFERALEIAAAMLPTPVFFDNNTHDGQQSKKAIA